MIVGEEKMEVDESSGEIADFPNPALVGGHLGQQPSFRIAAMALAVCLYPSTGLGCRC